MGFRKIFLLLAYLFQLNLLIGQGSYLPPEADLSFPRTIIEATEIETIRTTLSDPFKMDLFASVYQYANRPVPEGNESAAERNLRSTIAREAAFVILMNKKFDNGHIIDLPVEERQALLTKVLYLLEYINAEVGFEEGWLFFHNWQFRCRELTHYLVAYDLLKGSSIEDDNMLLAKNNLQLFAGNLHSRLTDVYFNPFTENMDLEFFFYNTNNHGVMNAAAIGLAAIVLSDVESSDPNYQPIKWINTAMYNLDYVMWSASGLLPRVGENNVLAGYAEGPSYLNYGFHTAMPFFRSFWNFLPQGNYSFSYKGETKSIVHPWYNENYHGLYEWMNKIRMPNGSFPAIHDTPSGFRTSFMALSGIPKYNILYPNSRLNTIWTRSQYLSTNVSFGEIDDPLFQALPEAGSLVFRSDWINPDGVYMHLIGKNGTALAGAKAHHQADATSFEIFYHDEILALDEGYGGANFRDFVKKPTDHNLILVNGKGPEPPSTEWVDIQNEVFIERFFDTDYLDYGELRAGWEGVSMTRKTMFQNDRYFIMADFIESDEINDYQYQFHGNGLVGASDHSSSGKFVLNEIEQACLVSRGEVNLETKVIATGNQQTYSVSNDSMYNGVQYKEHSKMLVHQNQVSDTEFLSVFYPYTNEEGAITIERVDIDEETNSFKMILPEEKHLVFIQNENELKSLTATNGIGKNVRADGQINFISLNSDDTFNRLFVEEGKQFYIEDQAIVLSEKNIDVAYEKTSDDTYKGYVSDAGIVQLFSDSSLIVVSGDIESITYDDSLKMNTISFLRATNFELKYGASISVSNQFVEEEEELLMFPNPTQGDVFFKSKNSNIKIKKLQLFSINGTLLQEKKSSNDLDLTDLSPGIYFVKIELKNGKSLVRKVGKVDGFE